MTEALSTPLCYAVSHHKAKGTWDSPASKDQPLGQYKPQGSFFSAVEGLLRVSPWWHPDPVAAQ